MCLRNATSCARRCRVSIAIRLASAPIIRCCAAVGGSDALRMRHTPCGCRSADLVGVQPNFRLPPVSTMRRAQQCRYFASSLPPSKRHLRLTIVRRGCNMNRLAGTRGEATYTAPDSTSAAALRATDCQCSGVEGQDPSRSLGGPRGIFSHVREYPPYLTAAPSAAPPLRAARGTLPVSLFRETKSPRRDRRGLLAVLCVYF